jgi:NAD-dependent dihydropyrimidine dehydrogenase PreA subunit
VCPVDCIYGLTVSDEKYRRQLFIHPEECINCAACEPDCPWGAIFEDVAVPEIFKEDIVINAEIFDDHSKDDFTTTPDPMRQHPTPDEIGANYKKWGHEKWPRAKSTTMREDAASVRAASCFYVAR